MKQEELFPIVKNFVELVQKYTEKDCLSSEKKDLPKDKVWGDITDMRQLSPGEENIVAAIIRVAGFPCPGHCYLDVRKTKEEYPPDSLSPFLVKYNSGQPFAESTQWLDKVFTKVHNGWTRLGQTTVDLIRFVLVEIDLRQAILPTEHVRNLTLHP